MPSYRTVFAASASPVASGVAGRIDGQDGTALSLAHHGLMLIDVILPARLAAIHRIYLSVGEYGADPAAGASSATKSISVTGWPVKVLPASLAAMVEGIRKSRTPSAIQLYPQAQHSFCPGTRRGRELADNGRLSWLW